MYDALNRLTSAQIVGASAKTTDYDSIGNITSKSDVGTYAYPTTGSPLPHAVSSITGTVNGVVNPSFTYDLNGNQTAGAGRTLTWTSFNLPKTITQGASTLTFTLDPEHRRIKQVAPTETTIYLDGPGSGLHVEKVLGTGGSVKWNNYIYAGGGMVAAYFEIVAGSGTSVTRYFHRDNLGSIAAITDETGTVVERDAYDSWGKRRYPNGTDDPNNAITSLTNRGFTAHEHLEEVALIHMNGRAYDPLLGRFISADPFIQDPLNGQSLNRFAYGFNNPLAYTDPSGYFSFGHFFGSIFSSIAKAVFGIVGLIPGVQNFVAHNQFAQFVILASSAFCGEAAPACAAANSAYITAVKGGKAGDILRASVIAAATTAAFNEVGNVTNGHFGLDPSTGAGSFGHIEAGEFVPKYSVSDYFFSPDHLANIAGHAAVGCVSAVAGGGQCGPQAFAGAAGALVGPQIADQHFAVGTAISAVIGGSTSVLGGGKFYNGAVTAAFGYLFNASAQCLAGGGCSTQDIQGDAVRDPTQPWLDIAAGAAAGATGIGRAIL